MIEKQKASELNPPELALLLRVPFTDDEPPLSEVERGLLYEEKLKEEKNDDPR